MAPEFRRGFKAECERLALEYRAELKLDVSDRLDPAELAKNLAIPVVSLSELLAHGARPKSVQHFHGRAREELSAATVFQGTARLIVFNQTHSLGRRSNSTAHELAHGILEHEPSEALAPDGHRRWDPLMEREADWLAGALLVPRDTALLVARAALPIEAAAEQFGVSVQLMNWRLNETGARRQAARERARKPISVYSS
ncbi:MAG: ImmA/IrrE family metallo-endopeptidase [Deltaproteobacteria bacterium]|nr:ImmA/IrrE family metallo-endopeptidase [Deltaproteobacteria bacterium]